MSEEETQIAPQEETSQAGDSQPEMAETNDEVSEEATTEEPASQ